MKLRTAAVVAMDDDGNTVGGPYFLPLNADDKRELSALLREFGPIEPKEKQCNTHQ